MTDKEFLIKLGKQIKSLRQAKNVKQFELAHMCDFEKASMSRIEAGITNPTMLTLKRISEALNTDMELFFKEQDTTIIRALHDTRYHASLEEKSGNKR